MKQNLLITLLLFFSLRSSHNENANTNSEHLLSAISILIPIQKIIESYLIEWEFFEQLNFKALEWASDYPHTLRPISESISPCGRFKALIRNKTCTLTDLQTNTDFPLKNGSTQTPQLVSFSPQGNYLAIGFTNGIVDIYDHATRTFIHTIPEYDPLYAVNFLADGKLCIETKDYLVKTFANFYLEQKFRPLHENQTKTVAQSKTCTIL